MCMKFFEKLSQKNENMSLNKVKVISSQTKRRPSCRLFLGAILIFISTILILGHLNGESVVLSPYYLETQELNTSVQYRNKAILLYTPFFSEKNWDLPNETNGPEYFKSQHCSVVNCVITSNHNYLKSIEDYDALLIHNREIQPAVCPEHRHNEQVFVFFLLESPVHSATLVCAKENYYNMTMTYRLDSDFLASYGGIQEIQTEEVIAPAKTPRWMSPPDKYTPVEENELIQKIATKGKMASWFVSHCHANSGRDDLVRELQKHFTVDIYGGCGKMSCQKFTSKCDELLDSEYKFYFSFENSLCKDYVTEKLYKTLERFIVPVVYGGANYSLFAPPHSYIDANDYDTPEALAKYLLHLDKNPKEYIKYFWWKKYYQVVYETPYCELCKTLNGREKAKYYPNVAAWWKDGQCHNSPRIQFKRINKK